MTEIQTADSNSSQALGLFPEDVPPQNPFQWVKDNLIEDANGVLPAFDDAVTFLTTYCHGLAANCGWWTDPKTGQSLVGKRNVPEALMLIVTEVAEAMEGYRKNAQDDHLPHRKNAQDDHLPHRKSLEVELADTLIRIFDFAGGMGLDLGTVILEKLRYNANRADHKLENRVKDGGKIC